MLSKDACVVDLEQQKKIIIRDVVVKFSTADNSSWAQLILFSRRRRGNIFLGLFKSVDRRYSTVKEIFRRVGYELMLLSVTSCFFICVIHVRQPIQKS